MAHGFFQDVFFGTHLLTITYLKSLSPIEVLDPIPEKVQEILNSFVTNEQFQSGRKSLAQQFPQINSFSIHNHIGENFFDLPICKDLSLIESWRNIPDCNLHLGKVETEQDNSLLLYFFNFMVEVKSVEQNGLPLFTLLHGKQNIVSTLSNFDGEEISSILIPFQTSKEELHQWVDDNWHNIQKNGEKLPEFTPSYIPINLSIGQEILELRDKKLTFAEISNQLSEKYPDDERLMDENQVKLIFHRFKEYFEESQKSIKILNSFKRNIK